MKMTFGHGCLYFFDVVFDAFVYWGLIIDMLSLVKLNNCGLIVLMAIGYYGELQS